MPDFEFVYLWQPWFCDYRCQRFRIKLIQILFYKWQFWFIFWPYYLRFCYLPFIKKFKCQTRKDNRTMSNKKKTEKKKATLKRAPEAVEFISILASRQKQSNYSTWRSRNRLNIRTIEYLNILSVESGSLDIDKCKGYKVIENRSWKNKTQMRV